MENDVVTVRREALHRALLQYYEYPAGEILGLADAYALAVLQDADVTLYLVARYRPTEEVWAKAVGILRARLAALKSPAEGGKE